MLTNSQSRGQRILTVSVLIAGLSFCLPLNAQAQTPELPEGGYEVADGATYDDHEGGTVLAFRTTESNTGPISLMFYQKSGTFAGKAFVCDNAIANRKMKSLHCGRLMRRSNTEHILETLTVGKLEGKFCEDLEGRYPKAKTGYEPVICLTSANCMCYEIAHLCTKDDGKSYADCGSSVAQVIFAPPGRGAGSGGAK
jgi:hypothetical protein